MSKMSSNLSTRERERESEKEDQLGRIVISQEEATGQELARLPKYMDGSDFYLR